MSFKVGSIALFAAIILLSGGVMADAPGYPPYTSRDDSFGREDTPGRSHGYEKEHPARSRAEKPHTRSPYEKLSESELFRYQFCGDDRDCVVAQNGCCDCANGGEDVAVNKDRLQDFKDQFECDKAMCTERASVPPCLSGVVTCINHRCKYVAPEEFRQ